RLANLAGGELGAVVGEVEAVPARVLGVSLEFPPADETVLGRRGPLRLVARRLLALPAGRGTRGRTATARARRARPPDGARRARAAQRPVRRGRVRALARGRVAGAVLVTRVRSDTGLGPIAALARRRVERADLGDAERAAEEEGVVDRGARAATQVEAV